MTCAACSTATKDWNGSDRKCAFPDGSPFSSDNWMCATVQMVRELFWDQGPGQHSCHQHHIFICFGEDQWTATIDLSARGMPFEIGRTLWVSWYKSRGKTDALWLLDEDAEPRRPTETEILAIMEGLKG